jgi:hypothetical protein
MYDHILKRIQPGLQENIYQVLAWVAHSERHLTLQEIASISSLHYDSRALDRVLTPDRTYIRLVNIDPQVIIAPLSGLIYTYPIAHPYAEGILSRIGVRLTHVSVKEFLEKEGHRYKFLYNRPLLPRRMMEFFEEEGHNNTFTNYSLSPGDVRRFIADASLTVMKNWLTLRIEPGSDATGNSKDVGQLATVFDLAWPG